MIKKPSELINLLNNTFYLTEFKQSLEEYDDLYPSNFTAYVKHDFLKSFLNDTIDEFILYTTTSPKDSLNIDDEIILMRNLVNEKQEFICREFLKYLSNLDAIQFQNHFFEFHSSSHEIDCLLRKYFAFLNPNNNQNSTSYELLKVVYERLRQTKDNLNEINL